LHIRDNKDHVAAVEKHGIQPIDMVVVNLYAFEKAAERQDVTFEALIENIDIGGPSMVRSAAKNFHDVAIVTSAADYDRIAQEMSERGGGLSLNTKWDLSKKAFALTAAYDAAIARTLAKIESPTAELNLKGSSASEASFPQHVNIELEKVMDLRYGENPHQKAALYACPSLRGGVAQSKQLQGKELSYNNIVDMQAAWDLAQEFKQTACAIIKHTNPCGTALGETLAEAYSKALEADPVSAFGGVIGVNRQVDAETAELMAKLFVEVIAAPKFSSAAIEIFGKKKNLRLVEVQPSTDKLVSKHVSGGMLVQDADLATIDDAQLKVVTKRQPTESELKALKFAWIVCKHVKSNAIVYAREGQSVGVGAGQMSRVASCRIGAAQATLPVKGTVAASDAFFPFPDGVEEIAKAGATAIIQPGGSVNDAAVIEAADRLGLAMVFTGIRHFRH
jgi:phosphoribosylaminoimidazolecarboxamide formyltransferase/IMP cyclohydrolase